MSTSTSTKTNNTNNNDDDHRNDPTVVNSDYVAKTTTSPLRVCCYGSSSGKTPKPFLKEAWNLGYLLAKRGHTCVNGAGSMGCMAAMNDGADAGDGHIVGVIHEMFLVDGNDFIDRDGGAHGVFSKNREDGKVQRKGKREFLIAGGNDLQERKRLLVENANALIVLPGGPGTWDELWEMACSRNLGLTNLPIVCVSVDGYYDSFRDMLVRAYDEGLVKNKPDDVIHFVTSSMEAVQWMEEQNEINNKTTKDPHQRPKIKTRASVLKRTSFLSPPLSTFSRSTSWFSTTASNDDDEDVGKGDDSSTGSFSALQSSLLAFAIGSSIGFLLGTTTTRQRQ